LIGLIYEEDTAAGIDDSFNLRLNPFDAVVREA
jgi:hypothetical protein